MKFYPLFNKEIFSSPRGKYQFLLGIRKGNIFIKRLGKYLSLFSVGFALWIGHLWDLLIEYLEIYDRTTHSWLWRNTVGLFSDEPVVRIYPLVKIINEAGFLLFIAATLWLILWIYADSYCSSMEKGKPQVFLSNLVFAAIVNTLTYIFLRVIIP